MVVGLDTNNHSPYTIEHEELNTLVQSKHAFGLKVQIHTYIK
jgi:hypothetical protein